MTNLKLLERRIQADRVAVRERYTGLRQSINHRVGSPAGLGSGFAVGFAGGWLTMSRRKRRRAQAERCPEPESGSADTGHPRARSGMFSILRTVVVLGMPIWQRWMMQAPAQPPEGGDAP